MLLTDGLKFDNEYTVISLYEFYNTYMTENEKVSMFEACKREYEQNNSETLTKEMFERDIYAYTKSDSEEITKVLSARNDGKKYRLQYHNQHDIFSIQEWLIEEKPKGYMIIDMDSHEVDYVKDEEKVKELIMSFNNDIHYTGYAIYEIEGSIARLEVIERKSYDLHRVEWLE